MPYTNKNDNSIPLVYRLDVVLDKDKYNNFNCHYCNNIENSTNCVYCNNCKNCI